MFPVKDLKHAIGVSRICFSPSVFFVSYRCTKLGASPLEAFSLANNFIKFEQFWQVFVISIKYLKSY